MTKLRIKRSTRNILLRSKVIVTEVSFKGKIYKLTDAFKRKFIPSLEERRDNRLKIIKGSNDREPPKEDIVNLDKKLLDALIENQRGTSKLFTGWDTKEDFKTWDDFMKWHDNHKGKKK